MHGLRFIYMLDIQENKQPGRLVTAPHCTKRLRAICLIQLPRAGGKERCGTCGGWSLGNKMPEVTLSMQERGDPESVIVLKCTWNTACTSGSEVTVLVLETGGPDLQWVSIGAAPLKSVELG